MLPSPIVSSGSILALWFTTDFAVSAQGFKAVYEGKQMRHCSRVCVWVVIVIDVSEKAVIKCNLQMIGMVQKMYCE